MVRELISRYKSLLLLLLSSLIIITIYRQFNWIELLEIIRKANLFFLLSGSFISILLGYICSIRYSYFSSTISSNKFPSISTSLKSYFIASSLNLLLPSKLGDLGKGFIAERIDKKKYPQSLQIFTLYEKASDLFALLFIAFITGLILIIKKILPNPSHFIEITLQLNLLFLLIVSSLLLAIFIIIAPIKQLIIPKLFKKNLSSKIIEIFNFKENFNWKNFYYLQVFSIFIWLIHIFQMQIFAFSIGISLWNLNGVFVLIFSVLIGLLPFSFAGIGTRDAAVVFFLSPIFGTTKPLILGILLTMRYIIPAVIGLLFFKKLRGA